jgi:curved DNA-binding protein CbpA
LCLYLVYTLAQALYDIKLAGDFYTFLGVSPGSPEREIKAKFRRLAAIFHPDKVRENNLDIPEDAFVQLRLAQDTLLDPAKKFAYERFGPGVVRTVQPGLKTTTDYVYLGLRSKMPEYAGNLVMLVLLNYVWLSRWGQFWRYFAVAVMAFLELFFLTHEWTPSALLARTGATLHAVFPQLLPAHLLPFQILSVARRLSMSLNIFISQLAPPSAKAGADPNQLILQQVAHLNQIASGVDAEATSLLQLQMAPFKGSAHDTRALRSGMRESLVSTAVKSNPAVRKAVQDAIARRQVASSDHEHEVRH